MKHPEILGGICIIEDIHMTKTVLTTVARSWRERFVSWPWRPWRKTKVIGAEVPMTEIYQLGDKTFVMHPIVAQKFYRQLENQ